MTKLERRRLLALVKKFEARARKASAWAEKNRHKCGHSNTDDALGDEGWHRLHQVAGEWYAFDLAADELSILIAELENKKAKK